LDLAIDGSKLVDAALVHWADQAAARTLAAHAGQQRITVAAGITPSGVVHVGNFREVITVDLVARALGDRGANVRFVYSWDDFDVFRKVPQDMPNQDMLHKHLGHSIVDVPDPWGETDSYASHHIQAFERSLAPLGIVPEFIRQSARYRQGTYAQGIRTALERKDTIRSILNRARVQHTAKRVLPDDWMPLYGFCERCRRDNLRFEWPGDWVIVYTCDDCGHRSHVDVREGGNIKLPWRVDWPMRWAYEQICFEPGGKDHSSAGGSYDTAKAIVREVYDWRAPEYLGYDFVGIKGSGGKISSSKGGVITVSDCLEVYEPAMLRWLFASHRPNTEFQISFDLDVIKLYEDYDRSRRVANEPDDSSQNDKKRIAARRTLQLSSVAHQTSTPSDPVPFQPMFRHLSMVLQIYGGDLELAYNHYVTTHQLRMDEHRDVFFQRAKCVRAWLESYAPEEFRYRLRDTPVIRTLSETEAEVLRRLVAMLGAHPHADEGTLTPHMKTLLEGTGLDGKTFFPLVYDLVLGRDHGPKLTTLFAAAGTDKIVPLLRPSLELYERQ